MFSDIAQLINIREQSMWLTSLFKSKNNYIFPMYILWEISGGFWHLLMLTDRKKYVFTFLRTLQNAGGGGGVNKMRTSTLYNHSNDYSKCWYLRVNCGPIELENFSTTWRSIFEKMELFINTKLIQDWSTSFAGQNETD